MKYQDKLLLQEEADFLIEALLNKTEREQIIWECESYYVWNHLAQTEPCNRYEIWNEIDFCTSFQATAVHLEVFIRLISMQPTVAIVEVSLLSQIGLQSKERYTLLRKGKIKQLALKSLLNHLMEQCALLCPKAATNIQYFTRDAQSLGCVSSRNVLLIQFAIVSMRRKNWAAFYRATL